MIRRRIMARLISALGLALAALVGSTCTAGSDKPVDFSQARLEMVENQIKSRGVSDPEVLKAMRKVERHRFVPEKMQRYAYEDYPLPIGAEQTISQPYIVALMTELLKLDSTDRVLEIGTGSGYQAAVLGELAGEVYTIEILDELAENAARLLKELGYDNVTVKSGDGYIGWEEHAPFDAVIVTCAPPKIPKPLMEQLAEGGRMVVPVGEFYQELILVENKDGLLSKTSVIPVRFVPMTGEGIEKDK
jgi:protein-L-isoaspartate(D-aspartate) O-methyltransferase